MNEGLVHGHGASKDIDVEERDRRPKKEGTTMICV